MQLWENSVPFYNASIQNEENNGTSTMDLYLPQSLQHQGRGLVLVCPGGGYGMRAEHEGPVIAQYLNQNGFPAAVLNYRVAPYRYPAALADAKRAIRLLRHNAVAWGFDPHKIAVMGFSAGGHLAGMLSSCYDEPLEGESADDVDLISARPDLSILCYPVLTSGPHTHAGSMENLLGENPSPQALEPFSVDKRVHANTPPTFLWHTADDNAVPVENSLLMANALRRNNVPFSLHIYDHGHHGLGLAAQTPCESWGGLLCDWLSLYRFK